MAQVFISLGSNIGDRLNTIKQGLTYVNNTDGLKVSQVSKVYETEPVGYEEQDWFYNAVARLECQLPPGKLLEVLMDIEKQLGRKRLIRWGPRTIDLDILLYEDREINEENLIIPHPRMTERAFVMVPLHEIAPAIIIPGIGKVKDIMGNVENTKKITCILQKIW